MESNINEKIVVLSKKLEMSYLTIQSILIKIYTTFFTTKFVKIS